jgi:FkbM family methyltransferase
MSFLDRLRRRVRAWGLRRIALPLLEREFKERRLHLYTYVEATDRLFPIRRIRRRDLSRRFAVGLGSDDWYRALSDRELDVEVAVEVGVNYGYTSTWISRWARRVHAFEPHPDNARLVREHLRIRQVTNIELHESALSDREGIATLHVRDFDGHHSLSDVGASETRGRRDVPVTTLDRFAESRGLSRIGFLKVDVEGFETEVFRGAAGLLGSKAVDLILFEYSPDFYRRRGLDPRAPLAALADAGYRVTTLDGRSVDVPSIAGGPQVDLLAAP